MITQGEAAQIAERIVGAPADDPNKGWTLEEFGHGWVIEEKSTVGLMGAGTRVVEKESGRVMNFPSFIPPDLVLEEYAEVLEDAWEERPGLDN